MSRRSLNPFAPLFRRDEVRWDSPLSAAEARARMLAMRSGNRFVSTPFNAGVRCLFRDGGVTIWYRNGQGGSFPIVGEIVATPGGCSLVGYYGPPDWWSIRLAGQAAAAIVMWQLFFSHRLGFPGLLALILLGFVASLMFSSVTRQRHAKILAAWFGQALASGPSVGPPSAGYGASPQLPSSP